MIVTTEQANKMFCPMMAADIDRTWLCISSSCMYWRWTGNNHSEGYCGGAGKPVEDFHKTLEPSPDPWEED